MKFDRVVRFTLASFLLLVTSLVWTGRAGSFEDDDKDEDGYGTMTGQFVLDGEIPEPKLLVAKGDPQARDPGVCAANDLHSDEFVVDSKTKGIANIFIFKRKARHIHPSLKETPKEQQEVVFDQKGCRFIPHALVLRTDQTVVVKSDDNCSHNTHTIPWRNDGENFVLQPNYREGIKLKLPRSEFIPFIVECNIHSWMKAWWLVLDHPYATKTDAKGQFTIEKLPVGEHEFYVWHERVGWIDRKFTVKIEKGLNKLEVVKVPLARFAED